jgi:hypothetical protein
VGRLTCVNARAFRNEAPSSGASAVDQSALSPRTPQVLPLVAETQAAIAAMPAGEPFKPFLHRNGEPFEPLQFTCWFRRAALAAGLAAGKTAHGLRKAACRRLAEAGCSANVIAAVSGHRDWREIRRYTEKAEQARLARQGMAAVAEAFSGEQNTDETFLENRLGNTVGNEAESHAEQPKTEP